MCKCLDSDRMFTHTYCTPELEVAMNMGYSIIQIHEVLLWEETEVYDHVTKKGGLFTGYINAFLKLKQESSGYPQYITSEEGKKEYIEKYFEHEGILLEKESISKNPGLRSLSKLALNSFYGKFGQRTNMKKTVFVKVHGPFKSICRSGANPEKTLHIRGGAIQVYHHNQ